MIGKDFRLRADFGWTLVHTEYIFHFRQLIVVYYSILIRFFSEKKEAQNFQKT